MVGEYLNKAMHQEIAEIDVFIEWMESVLDVYKSKSTALKALATRTSGAQGSNSGARSTPSKGGSGVAVGPLKNGICPLDLDASIPDVCAQSAEVVVPHTSPGSGGGHSSLEGQASAFARYLHRFEPEGPSQEQALVIAAWVNQGDIQVGRVARVLIALQLSHAKRENLVGNLVRKLRIMRGVTRSGPKGGGRYLMDFSEVDPELIALLADGESGSASYGPGAGSAPVGGMESNSAIEVAGGDEALPTAAC